MSINNFSEFGRYLISVVPKYISNIQVVNNELIIITNKDHLINLLLFLRDNNNCQFKQLIDISGVDYPEEEERFQIVYNLLSIKYNFRIRVKLTVDETQSISSCVAIYKSAGWYEREIWDLYGIYFNNHPDLRRILTDYGFEGFPLRKDFPLSGYTEVRYDDEQKRVISEPIEFTQEFRNFEFDSPWEQSK